MNICYNAAGGKKIPEQGNDLFVCQCMSITERSQENPSEQIVWVQYQRRGEDIEDEAECDGDEFVCLCQ